MKPEVVITEGQLPSDVVAAIAQGRKIEAIKILRESTGLGLANAKVLVERAWRTHGPEKPIKSFADQRPGLSSLVKLLSMLFLFLVAYYFYTGS